MNKHDRVLETETVCLQNKNLSSFQIHCYCQTETFAHTDLFTSIITL